MNEITINQEQSPVPSPAHIMLNSTHMSALVEFSKMMAGSIVMVPKHLQGKPADCLAIAMQAAQWGMNPFTVAQKTHVVNGTLGYEAQLVNAVVASSGAIEGGFRYEFRGEGQNLECRVGAVQRGASGELTWGEWLRSGDIQVKNSPLWKVNPKQQMGYLQVKNWARLYCPGAILGVYSDDELGDSNSDEPEQPTAPRGPKRKSESAKPLETVEEVTPVDDEPKTETAPAPATPTRAERPTAGATGGISTGQIAYLRRKLADADVAESAICARFEVGGIEELAPDLFDLVKAELLSQV